jgi:nitrite reductase (NADH) large subunit
MRYLVVGSGPAGISAAEEIRKGDPDGAITLITADADPAISPVMLTYWVSGRYPAERLFFRATASWTGEHRVELRRGEPATAVDVERQTVTLSGGTVLRYDRLLVATGATPVIPPILGIGAKGVHPFRTPADAEGILTSRPALQDLAIMGGGFIGIKLACHLQERGIRVAVFEKEPRLASRIFDQRGSDIVREHLRSRGLAVETGTGIAEVSAEDGWVSGVRLEDGREFPAQILVVAVGVRPNTALLDAALGAVLKTTRGGIPVNEAMETPLPRVYAAGDAASTLDSLTAAPFNNAVWPAATRQGAVAGANMAGGRRRYVHNFSLNAMDLSGLQVASAGHPYLQEGPDERGRDEIRVFQEETATGYRKAVLRDGVLIGFILIGDASRAGLLLSRMKRRDRIADPAELFARGSHALSGLPPDGGFRHGALWPRQHGGLIG